ncbi:uncharacterized protein K452DRAFT_283738 [Aplosporella prunicola CBS 121167]|uniref:Uncharacterized protein n=1 Tax=Aplosporella prunicola CBS 121167 TaxID=1176127 RepID=A0A6A6BML7_9PEZI|nr:uncharacterized protein K452DRAFT_283738 [Aplosporella prunicola CBS 121167]KAF2145379.1 hypothetical protein K452DRAFT_283738 [Aplosporella prunicola CBS 121167]
MFSSLPCLPCLSYLFHLFSLAPHHTHRPHSPIRTTQSDARGDPTRHAPRNKEQIANQTRATGTPPPPPHARTNASACA